METKRRIFVRHSEAGKKVIWRWRWDGVMLPQQKDDWNRKKLETNKERLFPGDLETLEGMWQQLASWLLTCIFQNFRTTDSCCFKPPICYDRPNVIKTGLQYAIQVTSKVLSFQMWSFRMWMYIEKIVEGQRRSLEDLKWQERHRSHGEVAEGLVDIVF